MDFWGTILVLFRRWYVVLPTFVLAVVAVGAVYVSKPINYASSSVLVVTAPATGATQRTDSKRGPAITNPLLNFDQGLSNTAAILIEALSTPEAADQLGVPASGDPSFQVNDGTNNPELLINAPFLVISAQSTVPGKAQDLVVRVVQRAQQQLAMQQQALKAPLSTYVILSEVVPPTAPQVQRGTRLRSVVSALAIGVIACITAAFGAESITTRPGRRQRVRPASNELMGFEAVANSNGTSAAQPALPVVTTQLPPDSVASVDERQD